MNCEKIMDMVYDYSGNDPGSDGSMPVLIQIQISFHTLFCAECTQKIELYENARLAMRKDFFPTPSVSLEDSIMARIKAQEESETEESFALLPGGFSTRSWVIAGLALAASLIIAFFSLDFQNLADKIGISFILPMGITIGIILTTYGALFIGSHLKELSNLFGLNNKELEVES